MKIYVVGLGPGDFTGMSIGTLQWLESDLPIILRTKVHPVVADLQKRGIQFHSFDDLYDQGTDFAEVYMTMAQKLYALANHHGEIVYAVPGHPLIAEQSVQNLQQYKTAGLEIVIGPGQSFIDPICSILSIDPISGLVLLDGTMFTENQIQPRLHMLIAQVFHLAVASEVKLTLMNVYPDDYLVTVIRAAGVKDLEKVEQIPLYELDRLEWIDHLTTVYVPPTSESGVLERDPWYVVDLVARLRAPDGCPWDRKQTHSSLGRYLVEEAYEVLDTVSSEDDFALADELGDVYLQILLHAQIGTEFGEFTLRDVYAALAKKIVRRHPHVFADAKAETPEEVKEIWESVKATERQDESILSGVKRSIPAYLLALEMQKRASDVGFDWECVEDVLEKVKEEMTEMEAEVKAKANAGIKDELGDVLFSLVNLGRWLEIDLDAALRQTIHKFEQRFYYVEDQVQKSGRNWSDLSLSELNSFWNQAKSY